MKTTEVIGSIVSSIVKIVVFVYLVILIIKGATAAYGYGYRIFTEPPMSSGEGRIITVEIKDTDDAKSIGKMLEEKGLVDDGNIFFFQELLSEHKGEEVPGIYDLSTAMTTDEMLDIICAQVDTAEEEEVAPSSPVEEESYEIIDEELTDEALTEETTETGEGVEE